MQYEGSSQFSQQPATSAYCQPDESNTHPPLTYLTALAGIKIILLLPPAFHLHPPRIRLNSLLTSLPCFE